MKTYLVQMAQDNLEASKNIASLLDLMNDYLRKKHRNSFYYSINGLYMHLLRTCITTLMLIAHTFPSYNITMEKYRIMPYKVAKERQLGCDTHLLNLCTVLTDQELDQEVDFYGSLIPVGLLIIKYFVHAAHHRGQISQILDEMQIKHDWL